MIYEKLLGENMNYFLESTVCITIFYGLYYLIFRRLTFIRLNRIYLLTSLVIGLSLPLISYQVQEVLQISAKIDYEETSLIPSIMNSSTPLISNVPIEDSFDWNAILQWIYVLGISFMLIKFSIVIYKLLKIKRILNGNDFISTQSNYANSSFFNLIFIDDSNLSESEINQILEHEKWHIRLFHSYDLLFVEILKIIFWFNPILWLYQRSLSEIHEYEVDTRMIQVHNPQMYAQLLLKLAVGRHSVLTPQLIATHQFSRKPLTDRIHFLFTKQKSVPMKRLAYLSVLPIFGAFFMAFSVDKVVDYQVIEESSKYFKIVRENSNSDEFGNVNVTSYNKVSSILYLYKDKIAFTSGSNEISEAMIIDASKYFKSYGYTLSVLSKQFDVNKKSLEKIEISLIDDRKEGIKRVKRGNENYPENNQSFNFNLTKMRAKSARSIGGAITIMANRVTGVHFVAPLSPPPPPPVPPKPPLAPPAPPKPPLPPIKLGFLNSIQLDSMKLVGGDELGKNPLVFINGKSYPSTILYKLNPAKIANSATYKSDAVLKKFGTENPDGAIELNTFNRSEKDLFLSKKQLNMAIENEKKRREAYSFEKSLTRITLKDFNGTEKDEVIVYKNGKHCASVTVSKGGEVFFKVGDVVKSENEMEVIDSKLLGGNTFATTDKKEMSNLGIRINGKPVEAIMKFNY